MSTHHEIGSTIYNRECLYPKQSGCGLVNWTVWKDGRLICEMGRSCRVPCPFHWTEAEYQEVLEASRAVDHSHDIRCKQCETQLDYDQVVERDGHVYIAVAACPKCQG